MRRRGKGITKSEEDVIRLMLQQGKGSTEIAKVLKRSRDAIQKRIVKMRSEGRLEQIIMDVGQTDGES
ncbi:MAG: hypothetical protein AAF429_14545 [Pseudomonadota bacterium]